MGRKLSHIDTSGNATMVDVSAKAVSVRMAEASGVVRFPGAVYKELTDHGFIASKGSILQTAIIAGIQGAKKTSDLIPLCHPLQLSKVDLRVEPGENALHIRCSVRCEGKTGVEMEALTGVSTAALTIYDMCKALSHDIHITDIRLETKTGGRHDYHR